MNTLIKLMQKSNEFRSNVCKNSNGITVLPGRIAIVLNCLNKTKVCMEKRWTPIHVDADHCQ